MKNPIVSIITVVLNQKKHIQQCIQSVLSQTYPNIEYIIIDGGSTDGTLDIIKKYQNSLSYWISEKDKGISHAFNKGIKACSGDIIGFLNSDDWYEPDAIKTVVKCFGDADILYGNACYWKNNNRMYKFNARHKILPKASSLSHPAIFVHKKVIKRIGLFDCSLKYAMDYDFLLRCFVENIKFVKVDKILANMRMYGRSDRNWLHAFWEAFKIRTKYFSFLTSFSYFVIYLFRRIISILLGMVYGEKFFQKIKKLSIINAHLLLL